MLSAGQVLRNERQKQGLDLSSLSKQTKISARILTAIENDETGQIPSAFLYKSFTRQFAAALKIDFSQITDQVNATADKFPTVRVPGQDFRPLGVAPIRQRREGFSGLASRVASLLTVVVLCSGLYAYVNQMEMPDLTTLRGLIAATPGRTGVALSSFWAEMTGESHWTHNAESTTADNAMPRGNAKASSVRPADEPILLRVAAVEQTWLSIESDGRHIFSGLLAPAETKVFEGRESARIRTGNAGGVTVVFNGRELGPLGERGQVRTVLFTSNDQYQILQPTLTSSLQLIPAVAFSRWMR